jgi:hypothetical protein
VSVRKKIVIVGILLLLAVGITGFFAVQTMQDLRDFQRQHALAVAGDVHSIQPWMTIPYISHVYSVPESYLYGALSLTPTTSHRHVTLHTLSISYNRPVNDLIRKIQLAIQTYRRYHPPHRHRPGYVLYFLLSDWFIWKVSSSSSASMVGR